MEQNVAVFMFSEVLYLSVPFGFGVENLEALFMVELVEPLMPEVCYECLRGTVPSRFLVPSFSVHGLLPVFSAS